MTHFKTLVAALDLTDASQNVAKEAKALAAQLKIPAVYIHVFEESAVVNNSQGVSTAALKKNVEKEMRRRYDLTADDTVILKVGRAAEQILLTAKKFKKPLIIAGHQGRNPLAGFFLGSTAERLALKSPYPVWIHRGATTGLPKSILMPSDFSSKADKVIQEIAPLQKSLRASLEVFHVFEEPLPVVDMQLWGQVSSLMKEEDDRRLKMFQKKHPKIKTVRAMGFSVADKIQEHSHEFDLLAISPRTSKTRAPLFGRISSRLVKTGEKPILVLP